MASDTSWEKIFKDYDILSHNFETSPFLLSAEQIKKSVQDFKKTNEKEVRILCMQTKRDDVPAIMRDNNLFLLPIKNGEYVVVKGEGYVDIPEITSEVVLHKRRIIWDVKTSEVGDSEMQHIDYAYIMSITRTFLEDDSLVQTIRGRKYTPQFEFFVGKQSIQVQSVQTEVDAGYEGKNQVVLIEGKNTDTKDTIIRQLYYPFRQWSEKIPEKKVRNVFFEKRGDEYMLWEYAFTDKMDYNSISLVKSTRYKLM